MGFSATLLPPHICCHTFFALYFLHDDRFGGRLAPDPIVVPKAQLGESWGDSLPTTPPLFAPRMTLGCQNFWFRNSTKLFSAHGSWMGHITVECKSKAEAEHWWQLRNSPFCLRHKSQIELIYYFFSSSFHSANHGWILQAYGPDLRGNLLTQCFFIYFLLYFSNWGGKKLQ